MITSEREREREREREAKGRERHRKVQKMRVMWFTHEEARPRNGRMTDTGNVTTLEKKNTNSEMGGLCEPRHERYRDNIR